MRGRRPPRPRYGRVAAVSYSDLGAVAVPYSRLVIEFTCRLDWTVRTPGCHHSSSAVNKPPYFRNLTALIATKKSPGLCSTRALFKTLCLNP